MSAPIPALCRSCTRSQGDGTCRSFPNGIPVDITLRLGDHRRSRAGEEPYEYDGLHERERADWLRYSPAAQRTPATKADPGDDAWVGLGG